MTGLAGGQDGGRPPVAFVKYYEKGSTDIAGDQVAAGLRGRGWDARVVWASEAARLRHHLLVFIKTSRLDHLVRARFGGCRLVLDVHDTVVFKRRIKNRWLYHALLFKNRRQLADFGRRGKPDRVLYHQWDPRYAPHRAPADRVCAAFLGERRSFELWGAVPEVECVPMEHWFTAAPRFNVHVSVRAPGREMLYKPNLKVSTAAACGAILLTTRDESAVELLGEDYPFYCEPSAEGLRRGLAALEAARGTAAWELAAERLDRVRRLTAPVRVWEEYETLFADLTRTGGAPAA